MIILQWPGGQNSSGYSAEDDMDPILGGDPCPGEAQIDNGSNNDTGSSGGSGGGDNSPPTDDVQWMCEVVVYPTDWYDCHTLDCSVKTYIETTYEIRYENCGLYSAMSTPTDDDACSKKDDDIPVIEPDLDKLILKSSFQQNEKLMCILDKLKGIESVEHQLKEFDSDMSVFNLNLHAVGFTFPDFPRPNSHGAVQDTYDPNDPNTDLYINTSKLNRPVLDIARTLFHEIIHAEIYRKVKSSGGLNGIDKEDFPGLLDYYNRHGKGFQHELMAKHYVKIISNALKEFDGGYENDEVYEALAWSGLKGKTRDGQTTYYQGYSELAPEKKKEIGDLRNEFLNRGTLVCQ